MIGRSDFQAEREKERRKQRKRERERKRGKRDLESTSADRENAAIFYINAIN